MLSSAIIGAFFLALYAYPLIDGYLLLNKIAYRILKEKEISEKLHRRLHLKSGGTGHGIPLPDIGSTLGLAIVELGRTFYAFEGVYLLFGVAALLLSPCDCARYMAAGFAGGTLVFILVYFLKSIATANVARAIAKLKQGG